MAVDVVEALREEGHEVRAVERAHLRRALCESKCLWVAEYGPPLLTIWSL
jgi:hypothetical protein